MDSYNFTNMVRDQTCFKSSKPTCIDLILTNGKGSLKSTTTAEAGSSDFHDHDSKCHYEWACKERPKNQNISGL